MHFVRVGIHGQIGRFRSADAARFPRGARVVLRTARGLEIGEVLGAGAPGGEADGSLLRGMTVEDELLAARLEQRRHEAFEACATLLRERDSSAVLMDVEHLLDGKGLYFYFLGEVPAEIERLMADLAEAYEAKSQFRRFTETLAEGCGPGCGTESAMGQGGCVACTSCAVANHCGTNRAD